MGKVFAESDNGRSEGAERGTPASGGDGESLSPGPLVIQVAMYLEGVTS